MAQCLLKNYKFYIDNSRYSKLELYNLLDIAIDTYCVDNTAEWLRSLVGTHAERLL